MPDQTYCSEDNYSGLSTDAKPSEGVIPGAIFTEIDTGDLFMFSGSQWFTYGKATDVRCLMETQTNLYRLILNQVQTIT